VAFFLLLRLNRTAMVAMITGTAAFTAGAGASRSLWMALAGWCLAVGGFSLDFYADRGLDASGAWEGVRHNPLADSSLPPGVGLAFSLAFVVASLFLTAWLARWSLLPWGLIVAVIAGLASHRLETPLRRALSLGLLQGLYFLMGGAAGTPSPATWLLAGVFFFAMLGGRGMTDIRDLPRDEMPPVQTLPKRYGIQATARFVAACLLSAGALSLAAYATGEFGPIYLYLDLAFLLVVVAGGGLFAVRPSPRLAYAMTLIMMMGAGTLICTAIVLGTLAKTDLTGLL
jgi:4-hydroxybenzoate polyprenyltransferase